MSNIRHTRFQDAEWYTTPHDIIVGGAGGIGSWLCILLARIGHQLYVFDDDIIEPHNIGGQAYMDSQGDQRKTDALATNVKAFTGENIVKLGRYEKESPASPIMFSAFDNMEARKNMFTNWCKQEDVILFVDGRMLAESGMVYFVTPDRVEAYLETLFVDEDVKEQPCSFKATSHSGAHIASLMVSGLNNHLVNMKNGSVVRDVPFKLEYYLQLLMLTAYDVPTSVSTRV